MKLRFWSFFYTVPLTIQLSLNIYKAFLFLMLVLIKVLILNNKTKLPKIVGKLFTYFTIII